MESYKDTDLRLKSFSSMLIVGKSGSGKSRFCLNVILNRQKIFSEPHDKIIYFYQYDQEIFHSAAECDSKIIFLSSREDVERELDTSESTLLVCDDFLTGTLDSENNNKFITKIFLEKAHHKKITILFQTQLLYAKVGRPWALNASHFVLFKSYNQPQIKHFFRNFGEDSSFLLEAYKDCTSVKYGHFLIILHPSTSDSLRYRSGLLIDEGLKVFRPLK